MEKEEWRDIPGYEGRYRVSSLGRVRSLPSPSCRRTRTLSAHSTPGGYRRLVLSMDGEKKSMFVHRLVAMAFIPNPDGLPYVNHRDENPANNRAGNLEWCTAEYNAGYGTASARSAAKRRGVPMKPEQAARMAERVRAWWQDPVNRERGLAAIRRTRHTPESRRKQSASSRGRHLGEEQRRMLSERQKGVSRPHAAPVRRAVRRLSDGAVWLSAGEAARASGVHPSTVLRACRKASGEWEFVDAAELCGRDRNLYPEYKIMKQDARNMEMADAVRADGEFRKAQCARWGAWLEERGFVRTELPGGDQYTAVLHGTTCALECRGPLDVRHPRTWMMRPGDRRPVYGDTPAGVLRECCTYMASYWDAVAVTASGKARAWSAAGACAERLASQAPTKEETMDELKWKADGKAVVLADRTVMTLSEKDAAYLVEEHNKVAAKCDPDGQKDCDPDGLACDPDGCACSLQTRDDSRCGEWFDDVVEAKKYALENGFRLFVLLCGAGCEYCAKWMERIGDTEEFRGFCRKEGIVLFRAPYGWTRYLKPHWKGRGVELGSAPIVFLFNVRQADPAVTGYKALYEGQVTVCVSSRDDFAHKDSRVFGRSFTAGEWFYDVYTGKTADAWNAGMMTDIFKAGEPYMLMGDRA